MRLLVTRPEPDAARTALDLRARGHRPIIAPLTRLIVNEAPPDLGSMQPAALLFTSVNAVRAVASWPMPLAWLDLPVFAVGDRTSEAAETAGFRLVRSADGDAGDLARLVQATLPSFSSPQVNASLPALTHQGLSKSETSDLDEGEVGRGTLVGKNQSSGHLPGGWKVPLPTLPPKGRGLRKKAFNPAHMPPALLYPAAAERTGDLEDLLACAGYLVTTIEAYRMESIDALPDAAVAALATSEIDGALFYSRRAAEIFVRLVDQAGLRRQASALRLFAISARAAEPLTLGTVTVAACPNDAALLALLDGTGETPLR